MTSRQNGEDIQKKLFSFFVAQPKVNNVNVCLLISDNFQPKKKEKGKWIWRRRARHFRIKSISVGHAPTSSFCRSRTKSCIFAKTKTFVICAVTSMTMLLVLFCPFFWRMSLGSERRLVLFTRSFIPMGKGDECCTTYGTPHSNGVPIHPFE